MSDRVTWASCPQCGAWAAVGWLDRTVVEVDCTQQCELTEGQIAEIAGWPGPVPPSPERGTQEMDYQPRARHSARCGRSAPIVVSFPCPG